MHPNIYSRWSKVDYNKFEIGDIIQHIGTNYKDLYGYIVGFGCDDIKVQWFEGVELWHLPSMLMKVEHNG